METLPHLQNTTIKLKCKTFLWQPRGITLSQNSLKSKRSESVQAYPETVHFCSRFVENHSNSCKRQNKTKQNKTNKQTNKQTNKRQVKSQELPTIARYMPLAKLFLCHFKKKGQNCSLALVNCFIDDFPIEEAYDRRS